jgi:lipopolysaccharide biosynthesis protein
MDYDKTLTRIYEHLDDDDVEKAVMDCLRLARGTKDYLNIATFLHELYPNDQEFRRVLYEEVTKVYRPDILNSPEKLYKEPG